MGSWESVFSPSCQGGLGQGLSKPLSGSSIPRNASTPNLEAKASSSDPFADLGKSLRVRRLSFI